MTKSGVAYQLPNQATTLEHLDGPAPDGQRLGEWLQYEESDCAVSGMASGVEFLITPDIVQCPYDNGFRQHMRVTETLHISEQVRARAGKGG